MHIATLYATILTLLAVSPTPAVALRKPSNSVLLTSVKSLTLRANSKTSHRRVTAIPQLQCIGPGCKHYNVDVMRCTNAGSDYDENDVQWTCTASLPEEFKLGSTDVMCEGYDSPEDPYILKGSCGVKYRLLLTDKGREKYGESSTVSQSSGWLFGIIFTAVAAWILYGLYTSWRDAPVGGARRQPRPRGGGLGGWGGGGGGGGGPDDPWDPPPPYPGKPSTSSRARPGQEGWRPGFWTGAATGAAASYLAGNRGQRQPPPPTNSGGWFGNSDNGWGAGPSRPTTRSSSSSTRHESTGFGSTTRR